MFKSKIFTVTSIVSLIALLAAIVFQVMEMNNGGLF